VKRKIKRRWKREREIKTWSYIYVCVSDENHGGIIISLGFIFLGDMFVTYKGEHMCGVG